MTTSEQQPFKKSDVCVQDLFLSLSKKVSSYNPRFDKEKLRRAFEFSLKAHDGQFRESGDPYIVHPLSVALILTEYYVCEDTIITVLLHDVLEDSDRVSYKKLKSEFGEKIADLVEGVTKINECVSSEYAHYKAELPYKAADAETIRKTFREAKQDIRLILIKLADRLHNMQTLDAVKSPVRRYRKAQETLSVFVPMAARLGIWRMKHELENLCFPYIFPDENKKICTFLADKSDCLSEIVSQVMRRLQNTDKNGVIRTMYSYNRSIFSLKKALDEKNIITLNDYLTLHVCVDNEDDCYLVLGLIHRAWKTRIKREEDHISNPRDNGYRAYHTKIITEGGFLVEIRIMTHEMRMKNWYGSAYECFQKREKNNAHVEFFVPFEILSRKTHGKSFKFLEAAKTDLLEEKIEVHISGESVYVPEVATVLDFVFYAFPERAVCVSKIFLNDKEVSFDKRLTDGDIVELDFDDKSTLSFKWFDLVKTATARMKIQEVLQSWELNKKIDIGKSILQREFDIYEKGSVDVSLNRNKKKMCDFFNVSNPKDLYVLIAEGELNSYEVFSTFFPKTKPNFFRKFFYKWDLFLNRFFEKRGHVLRLKIIGILENKIDILNTMNVARCNFGINASSTNLKENKKLNIFYFRMNISADNKKALRDFFVFAEYQKGVIRVFSLLSRRKQKWFLFWVLLTISVWGLIPLIFIFENQFILPALSSLKYVFLYASLVPMIMVNYILYSFMHNYFSQLRNTVWMIVIGLLLNLFGISIFFWQLVTHGFQVNLPIVIGFFSVFTLIFLYKYLSSIYYFEIPKSVKNISISRKNKFFGYLCALTVVVIWGIDPIIIRQLVSETDLYFTVGARFYLGGIFLFVFLLFQHLFTRRKSSISRVSYGLLFWLMVLGLLANFLLYHAGLQYTIASDANLIENFAPIIVLLLMGVLSLGVVRQVGKSKKEILKMITVVLIGVFGATLVFSYYPENLVSDYSTKLLGDFIEVIAMIFFALFIVVNNVYMKRNSGVSSLSVMAHVLLIAGLIFTPFLLFSGWPTLSSLQWLAVGFIGFFSTGLAYVLWSKAAKSLDIIPAVLLLNFTVIITIVLENHIYGLPMHYEIILGASLMIIASVSAEIVNKKRLRLTGNKRS